MNYLTNLIIEIIFSNSDRQQSDSVHRRWTDFLGTYSVIRRRYFRSPPKYAIARNRRRGNHGDKNISLHVRMESCTYEVLNTDRFHESFARHLCNGGTRHKPIVRIRASIQRVNAEFFIFYCLTATLN